jgi:hypothetical protein
MARLFGTNDGEIRVLFFRCLMIPILPPRIIADKKSENCLASAPETLIHNFTSSKKGRKDGSITGKQLFVD